MTSSDLTIRMRKIVADLENMTCADCPSQRPRWASFMLSRAQKNEKVMGVLCCTKCSQLHQSVLGKKQCAIKNLWMMHEWDIKDVEVLETTGNAFVNSMFEANLTQEKFNKFLVLKDEEEESMRRTEFIKGKYRKHKYSDDMVYHQRMIALLKKRRGPGGKEDKWARRTSIKGHTDTTEPIPEKTDKEPLAERRSTSSPRSSEARPSRSRNLEYIQDVQCRAEGKKEKVSSDNEPPPQMEAPQKEAATTTTPRVTRRQSIRNLAKMIEAKRAQGNASEEKSTTSQSKEADDRAQTRRRRYSMSVNVGGNENSLPQQSRRAGRRQSISNMNQTNTTQTQEAEEVLSAPRRGEMSRRRSMSNPMLFASKHVPAEVTPQRPTMRRRRSNSHPIMAVDTTRAQSSSVEITPTCRAMSSLILPQRIDFNPRWRAEESPTARTTSATCIDSPGPEISEPETTVTPRRRRGSIGMATSPGSRKDSPTAADLGYENPDAPIILMKARRRRGSLGVANSAESRRTPTAAELGYEDADAVDAIMAMKTRQASGHDVLAHRRLSASSLSFSQANPAA